MDMKPNVAAGLAFFFTLLSGIIFLVMEKKNQFVRGWAKQGVMLGAIALAFNIVIRILLAILPVGLWGIVGLLSMIVSLGFLVLWILGLINAFQGKEYDVPIIGALAKQYLANFLS